MTDDIEIVQPSKQQQQQLQKGDSKDSKEEKKQIKLPARGIEIEMQNRHGCRAIHYAVDCPLVSFRFRVVAEIYNLSSVLVVAHRSLRRLKCLELLIEHGASITGPVNKQ